MEWNVHNLLTETNVLTDTPEHQRLLTGEASRMPAAALARHRVCIYRKRHGLTASRAFASDEAHVLTERAFASRAQSLRTAYSILQTVT